MEQHRTIAIDGHSVHYRIEGQGPQTLVLLHGFLQSLDIWTPYVLTYMHHMRVVTIDLPGHGQSQCLAKVHTMELMARTVKTVLDHAGVNQCVMVGHSMGGYVASEFAHLYPYTLRGLGLVSSHVLPDTPEHRESRQAACRQVMENRASYIVGYIPNLFLPANRTALSQDIDDLCGQCLETNAEAIVAAQQGMMQRHPRIDVLQHLEVPILFIYGKHDPRIQLDLALAQAAEARHAEILLLEGAAHMPLMEQREYVKPRIRNFVDTCYY